MVKLEERSVETGWVNEFFRLYDGDVSYTQEDLRAWNVNLLDIFEACRNGVVIDGDKLDGPGAWWKIEGVTENAELFHVTVVAVTDVYFVEIIEVTRIGRKVHGRDDAA